MNDTNITDHEIRRALAGHAASISPRPNAARLRDGLVRADRLRTMRSAGAIGAVTIVAALGIFASQAGETTAPVDVVDSPDRPTAPDVDFPALDDAVTETSTTLPPETTSPPTTLPPITAGPEAPDEDPDHLGASVTTTVPVAEITATTTTSAPPPTSAPSTTAAPVATDFTAFARYGSCEEPVPYDEYSGTAAPGSTITITSPWSSTTQVSADGAGKWFLRVEFPTSPVGVPFDVAITNGGDSAAFDFVRTA